MAPGDQATTKQQAQLTQQCATHSRDVEGVAAATAGRGDEDSGAGNGAAGASSRDRETTASPFSWAAAAAASRLSFGGAAETCDVSHFRTTSSAMLRPGAGLAPRPQAGSQVDAKVRAARRGSAIHNI